jgi:hypothetical protein
MSRSEYKPTEDEILAMLKHLRHTAPEYATPEKAIFLLEQQRVHLENLEELYPEMIEELLKDFESR